MSLTLSSNERQKKSTREKDWNALGGTCARPDLRNECFNILKLTHRMKQGKQQSDLKGHLMLRTQD